MNKFQFTLIFIVLIFISEINAQSLPDSTFHYKNTSFGKDLSTFFETGLKIYSSPARFTGKDWIITGSVLAATGLAFFADDDVRDFWLRNQSKSATDILNIMQIYGNVGFASALSVTIYAGGKIFKDPDIAATGRMLVEGVFYSGLTNTILKISTGRSRPYLNQGPYFFKPFQFTEPHISFPSGHVTMAFTLSSILSDRIKNVFVTVGLYSLASATFIQRMYSDNHWLSDCILGAATGYFTGKAVVKFDMEGNSKKLSVLPFYEQRIFGFRIIYPM